MAASEYLFVYGTLRKSLTPGKLLIPEGHVEYVGRAHLHGKLFEVGGYPGAVLSEDPNDQVKGEVYLLNDPQAILARLDEYEGCGSAYDEPHEYKRLKLVVALEDGGPVCAWVYLYNWPTGSLTQIESGDYLEFIGGGEAPEGNLGP